MARVLLTNDKGPDCPLFSTKPIFKTLFSSDNLMKCAFIWVIQCLIYIIYAFFEKFRIKNEQISSIVNY